jgi:hypothetical protein
MIAVCARPRLAFPSREFFAALRERMNARPERYRGLGPLDLRLCLQILPDARFELEETYGLSFAGYRCDKVDAVCCPPEFGADGTIEGPYSAWKELFEGILASGRADNRLTLDSRDARDSPLRAVRSDPAEIDRIYRYRRSLRRFFEEAAGLEVAFAG